MCYRCQVCDRVHLDKGPALVIRQFREVPDRNVKDGVRKEIAKELLACGYCHEGYSNGMPLSYLAKAIRPEPKTKTLAERLGQQVAERVDNAVMQILGVPIPSPQKTEPPVKKRKSTDALIQAVETEGRNPRQNVRKHPQAAKRREQQNRPG